MLSYEICGGVQTASQGLMSLFTAILLGSGHYLLGFVACRRSCLQSLFFLLPTLPPTVSMVGMLGSTG